MQRRVQRQRERVREGQKPRENNVDDLEAHSQGLGVGDGGRLCHRRVIATFACSPACHLEFGEKRVVSLET